MLKSNKKQLYLGNVVDIYYSFIDAKTPKQLDQIAEWFPNFLIVERNNKKTNEPEYIDNEYKIYADKDNNGSFYSGGNSNRVTQIVGRLIGTAKSNQEKGRKDAELIRKYIAKKLVTDFDYIERLINNTYELLKRISEDSIKEFHELIFNYMIDLVDTRCEMSNEEKIDEAFPFDDYIFDDLIYNVAYQLHLFSYDGLVNAYLWLLLGGLLRNQVGSLTRMYHSGFVAVNRQLSEYGTLYDKINFLFNPDKYYSTYSGDDVDSKYPGITWKCDKCGAVLNKQEGFDENLSIWDCKDCRHINKIDISVVYENEEDYLNGISVDPKKFYEAIQDRKEEIDTGIPKERKIKNK